MPLANCACGERGSGVTPPVRCQCLGTRARTFAIGAAADGAVERTRTSIDAARLLAAAAVAIMTPSKRPSVTIDCVGLGHAATTEVHRKSLCWLGPAANLVNGDVNTPILSGGAAVALRDSMIKRGDGIVDRVCVWGGGWGGMYNVCSLQKRKFRNSEIYMGFGIGF